MAEAPRGRRRARHPCLLPVLALLFGALGLFAPAPALAQAVWSATLTVKAPDGDRGCFANTGEHAWTTAFDDDDFTVGDTDYDVYGLTISGTQVGTRYLYLVLNKKIPDAVKALKLCLGTTGFALSDGTIADDTLANDDNTVEWSSSAVSGIPSWSVGDRIPVSLASSCEAAAVPAEVTLSADGTTPVEGGTVTLTAALDAAAPADGVTLALKVLERVSQTIYTTATATSPDAARRPATGQTLPLVGVRARKWSLMTGMRWDAKAMTAGRTSARWADASRARLSGWKERVAGIASAGREPSRADTGLGTMRARRARAGPVRRRAMPQTASATAACSRFDRIPGPDTLVHKPEGCSAMATVTRADLTDAVHKEIGLPRRDAAVLVDTVIETIAERLEAGEDVKISSFGRFTVHKKVLRVGRNPKTGETVPILPRRVVAFRASAVLKKLINDAIGGRR